MFGSAKKYEVRCVRNVLGEKPVKVKIEESKKSWESLIPQ